MIGQTPSLSFEIFPPKPAVGNEKIIQTLDEMQGLAPHFISVTCSNNNLNVEETTVKLANHVRNELHIPTIAHLPAAYLTKEKVRSVLHSLDEIGVHQILALRGDIIEGLPPKEDFQYATDLISFIKEEAPHFDIIGACYPEVHPESPNSVSDIKNLKKKVDAG
ncbi:TPA: methylenetetrahydrofolate reductase, partial [Streptococcus suis]|nr:methylenetetrahydrofolate reductase [Streptococcus suis]